MYFSQTRPRAHRYKRILRAFRENRPTYSGTPLAGTNSRFASGSAHESIRKTTTNCHSPSNLLHSLRLDPIIPPFKIVDFSTNRSSPSRKVRERSVCGRLESSKSYKAGETNDSKVGWYVILIKEKRERERTKKKKKRGRTKSRIHTHNVEGWRLESAT